MDCHACLAKSGMEKVMIHFLSFQSNDLTNFCSFQRMQPPLFSLDNSGRPRIFLKNSDCNASFRGYSLTFMSENGAKGHGSKSPAALMWTNPRPAERQPPTSVCAYFSFAV
jgi:hypothetical protein